MSDTDIISGPWLHDGERYDHGYEVEVYDYFPFGVIFHANRKVVEAIAKHQEEFRQELDERSRDEVDLLMMDGDTLLHSWDMGEPGVEPHEPDANGMYTMLNFGMTWHTVDAADCADVTYL